MFTASERAKDRRSLRLEFLEERNLLSVVAPHAIAAEVAKPLPSVTSIHGSVQGGPATAGLYTPTHPGYQSFSGHGRTNTVGNILFSNQQIQTVSGSSVSITNGSALIVTFKGEQIDVVYTGTGTVVTHKPTKFTLQGSMTGGTGRFVGETGTFDASGTINRATGRFTLTFSITLNHATPV